MTLDRFYFLRYYNSTAVTIYWRRSLFHRYHYAVRVESLLRYLLSKIYLEYPTSRRLFQFVQAIKQSQAMSMDVNSAFCTHFCMKKF